MSRGRNGLRLKTLKYNLELTSRCNLRCGMCPMDEIDRPYEDAPWWMVEKIAAEMKELGLKMRYLHELGEPLLYKKLPEAIDLFPGRLRLDERDAPDGGKGEGDPLDVVVADHPFNRHADSGGLREIPGRKARGRRRERPSFSRALARQEYPGGHPADDHAAHPARAHARHRGFLRAPQVPPGARHAEDLRRSRHFRGHGAPPGLLRLLSGHAVPVVRDPRQWKRQPLLLRLRCDPAARKREDADDSRDRVVADARRHRGRFSTHDFSKLPRCAECFKNPAAAPPVTDRVWMLAQKLPSYVKDPLRRFLNRPNPES